MSVSGSDSYALLFFVVKELFERKTAFRCWCRNVSLVYFKVALLNVYSSEISPNLEKFLTIRPVEQKKETCSFVSVN